MSRHTSERTRLKTSTWSAKTNQREGNSLKKIVPRNDVLEREADALSAKLVQGGEPSPAREGFREARRGKGAGNGLQGSAGHPMDRDTQEYFSRRLEQDFSHVRIFSDREAAESASGAHALAYTTGNSVVFGEGQYEPGTTAGKKLIAHELVHVMQQSRDPGLNNRVMRSFDPDELLKGVLSAVPSGGGAVEQLAGQAQGAAGGLLGGLGGGLSSLTGAAGGLAGGLPGLSQLTGSAGGAASGLLGSFTGGLSSLTGNAGGLLGGITGGLSGGLSSLTGSAGGLLGGITGGLSGGLSSLTGQAGGLLGSITGGLSGGLSSLTGKASGMFGGLMSGITGGLSSLTGKAGGLLGGLTGGLSSLGGLIPSGGGGVTSLLQKLADLFKGR